MIKFYLSGVITVVFLFFTFVSVNAQTKIFERKITVKVKDRTIQEIFNNIDKETGSTFFFSDNAVDDNRLITVNWVDMPIDKFLQWLFAGKYVKWEYRDTFILISKGDTPVKPFSLSESQYQHKRPDSLASLKLSGKVVDAKGGPIEGASVFLRGTHKWQPTNSRGMFSFKNIPYDSSIALEVSSVGYERKIYQASAGQAFAQISLDAAISNIPEVKVATGFEKTPRGRVAGSITLIDNKQFNQQVATDVLSRLQYMASGVNMMPAHLKPKGTGLMVRGLSTFSGPTSPLIILDDFPYYGDLQNINPFDVESINILKDAAATSIWGAKAGNGVIVIVTKKGKYNTPLRINLTTNVTITEKPDLFSNKAMSPVDLIDVERYLFGNKFYDDMIPYPDQISFTRGVTTLLKQRSGELSEAAASAELDRLSHHDVRNDLNKHFYQKAVNKQYAVNISGGTSNNAWFFSAGFDDNQDELNEKYKRYTVRSFNIHQLGKKLELSTGISFTQSNSKSGAPGFNDFRPGQLPVYTEFQDEKGASLPLSTYNNYRADFLDTLGGGKLQDWQYYPLEDHKHVIRRTGVQEANAELGLKYNLAKGLSFSGKYRFQNQRSESRLYMGKESYDARNLINRFSQIDHTNNTIKYIVPIGSILDLKQNNVRSHELRGQADLNKTFGKHNIVAIAGGQISEVVSEGNSSRSYGYDDDTYSNQGTDFMNKYPDLITGKMENIPGTSALNKGTYRSVSTYMNAAYTFDDKYSFTVSGRRDAINILGVHTNDRWKPLWSTGISWLLSDESFYSTSLLPYLKLRLTYGKSGNVDPGKVAQITIRYEGQNAALNSPYARVENFFDPRLRWEQVSTLNAGIDFRTRGNRFSGSFDLYKKYMTDLYGESSVDVTAGLGRDVVPRNIGKMTGQGADIAFNSLNTIGRLEWRSNLIVNINSDRIVKLKDEDKMKPLSIAGGAAVGRKGFPVYAYFAYPSAGLDPVNGDPRGYVKGAISKDYLQILEGDATVNDLVYMGRMLPKVSGSLGNAVTWKRITLTMLVTYKFGYHFRKESINYQNLYNLLAGHTDYSKRWQQPGDERITTVPSRKYPLEDFRDIFYEKSSDVVVKGDHVRLQNINLNYEWDRSKLTRPRFQKMEFYFFMNNIGILWRANKEKIDPDHQGINVPASISLGTRISF